VTRGNGARGNFIRAPAGLETLSYGVQKRKRKISRKATTSKKGRNKGWVKTLTGKAVQNRGRASEAKKSSVVKNLRNPTHIGARLIEYGGILGVDLGGRAVLHRGKKKKTQG